MTALSLCFHGTGSGGNLQMGSAAATISLNNQPVLLIDCGPGTLAAFQQRWQQLPPALFITHAHMDHIADLEILSVRALLAKRPPIPMLVPLSVIPVLHQRLATYPGTLAEGRHNFWNSFQLIPVQDQFSFGGFEWRCYPTRHHAPNSCYALHLPGHCFYSADTRPIPEILHHQITGSEVIFHDCGLIPNPSHTGLSDLEREYQPALRSRLVLYHYADEAAAGKMEAAGYRVARPGDEYPLGLAPQ